MNACTIDGCTSPVYIKSRGLCNAHNIRRRRYGDPLAGGPTHYRDPEGAFKARTKRDGECLIWAGAKSASGYGTLKAHGADTLAHRYAWERRHGPIPEGVWIDHICYRRDCVEESHLRLATPQQNNRNQPGSRRGRAIPRGVYLDRRTGKYYVQVRADGETHYGGAHTDPWDAGKVAEAIRRDLFGEFAGRGIIRPDLIKQLKEHA